MEVVRDRMFLREEMTEREKGDGSGSFMEVGVWNGEA